VTPSLDTANAETLAAVCCSAETAGLVWLASRRGRIWKSADSGGSWTYSDTAAVSTVVVPFLSLAEVPASAGAASGLYAGSEGYGYYTVSSALALTRFADTSFSDLRASAIRRFYVDFRGANGTTLLALTTSCGLWRGEVSSTVSWSQE
jgi:hypothetical protein